MEKVIDPRERVGPKLYALALAGVNLMLKANGEPTIKELPAGTSTSTGCPIALALLPIGVTKVELDDNYSRNSGESCAKIHRVEPTLSGESIEIEYTVDIGDESPKYDAAMKAFGLFIERFDMPAEEVPQELFDVLMPVKKGSTKKK